MVQVRTYNTLLLASYNCGVIRILKGGPLGHRDDLFQGSRELSPFLRTSSDNGDY